ncbi:hypothetical protein AVEN_273538-1 [Araneus ventricosus]|uniref:DNA-directed DNA polymerase n=1 Tax=Araneus ventricosus TaxID=182803 RepID=A0A4Y2H3L9_ARAVE|nr:hypothetical protein AVEN_273538-1 [Araneus ventricosus]
MLEEDTLEIGKIIKEKTEKYESIKSMIDFDKNHYNRTNICYICENEIIKDSPNDENKKVIDHCHLTGKYRGPAHNICNLKYKIPNFIPVKIHNLTGYDSHLFIKQLGVDASKIDAIPNTEEKYISFSKKIGGLKLRFIDSFKFMSSSLDNLSKNLRKMPENELSKYPPKIRQMKYINYLKSKFRETSLHFPEDKLDLITRKGVYPYDYMDSKDKYKETKLPPKDKFYNKLNDCYITDEEYKHAQRVWKEFNIKNLGEYTDLYVKTDVLILTDVFENFRDVCLKTYKLDPDWYFVAPGLSWDAMLKMTKIKLDLLNDYDMILMLEKGLRGGVSQCCNRYGKANNKYMKNYDKSKESNYLMYLDANNLYGWAMSQYLPYGEFKWIKTNTIQNILKCPDDSEKGYILELDLEYPKELNDDHSDLPLCPENRIPENSKQAVLLLSYVMPNTKLFVVIKAENEMNLSRQAWIKTAKTPARDTSNPNYTSPGLYVSPRQPMGKLCHF